MQSNMLQSSSRDGSTEVLQNAYAVSADAVVLHSCAAFMCCCCCWPLLEAVLQQSYAICADAIGSGACVHCKKGDRFSRPLPRRNVNYKQRWCFNKHMLLLLMLKAVVHAIYMLLLLISTS
jgi:hypothetical protein